jgi:hypothetical protein
VRPGTVLLDYKAFGEPVSGMVMACLQVVQDTGLQRGHR